MSSLTIRSVLSEPVTKTLFQREVCLSVTSEDVDIKPSLSQILLWKDGQIHVSVWNQLKIQHTNDAVGSKTAKLCTCFTIWCSLYCFLVTVFTSRSFLLNHLPLYPPSNATLFIYLERMGVDWTQPTHRTSFACLFAVLEKEKKLSRVTAIPGCECSCKYSKLCCRWEETNARGQQGAVAEKTPLK